MAIQCPYCQADARLVTGRVIYPDRPDLAKSLFWRCAPCDAYVGCHESSDRPKGVLADSRLRRLRIAAHAAFDPLWRDGSMRRVEAYQWLADQLEIPVTECHIGLFDPARCRQVIAVMAMERTR